MRRLLVALAKASAFVLIFLAAGVVVYGLLAAPMTWLVARTGQRFRVDELLQLLAALAAHVLMLRWIDPRPWRDVGLDRAAARPRLLAQGWLVGTGAIALTCILLALRGWLRIEPAPDGPLVSAGVRVTLFLAGAALFEEVLCRGYLLTALRDGLGTWAGVVVSSVLFGAMHIMNPGSTWESVLLVTLAGVFLAMVRVVFDSLYAAWMAHLAWNWLMAVPLHAKVSGLGFEAPDYRAVTSGPEWISGGAWGPEGGMAAALGMIVGMAYLYTRRRREES